MLAQNHAYIQLSGALNEPFASAVSVACAASQCLQMSGTSISTHHSVMEQKTWSMRSGTPGTIYINNT